MSLDARLPIPNRTNAAVVVVQLVLVTACLYGAKLVDMGWELVGLAACFGLVMNSVYAVIHEAEHGILFSNRSVNDTVGTLMALFFPAPFHLIRQGHLGHHLRNRSDDEAFDLYFDGEKAAGKALQWYGILTGVFWAVVALGNVVVLFLPFLMKRKYYEFDRPTSALMDSFNPAYWRLIRLEALLAIVLHVGVIVGLGIPPLQYLLVYLGFGFMWSSIQYVHHYGTERHVTRGARNLWLFPGLDQLLLNHNWHLTHHKHPTVPWLALPAIGRDEDPRRDFLLWHYLRMWKGPRHSTERVENRYAGHVMR